MAITIDDLKARGQLEQMVAITRPKTIEKSFSELVVEHEDLVPFQTPFRIDEARIMEKWVSMFDDTRKVELDRDTPKPKGRENFLFLKNQDDLIPAITEQFRRYSERNPGISVGDAVNIFDQTGAEGKLKFLKGKGIDPNASLDSVLGIQGFKGQ